MYEALKRKMLSLGFHINYSERFYISRETIYSDCLIDCMNSLFCQTFGEIFNDMSLRIADVLYSYSLINDCQSRFEHKLETLINFLFGNEIYNNWFARSADFFLKF